MERGTWRPGDGGDPVAYRAAYRWTRVEGGLRLAHIRRGPDHPVELGVLAPDGDGGLATVRPHLCGEDRYDARLVVDGPMLRLEWRVRGPSKDQRLVHEYR